ncbi:MAG: 50S ribosomal protein L4 [Ignavibacteriales bacterium]|nr:50S ribosomal protein L4 [Ignavibacteriales bacterium]HOJ17798.1 50S ribosomal protein L4 [Ignavibacteriaceae bacterium]
MLLDIYKIDGTVAAEKADLADDVFAIKPNDHVVYLSVKAYLSNQRQGTHKSKERSEVKGGGKKPWRQKGRGGARAGTTRSPIWVGGGTIFGPKPRDYRQNLPKKVKLLAKKSALSLKYKNDQIIIIEDFSFENPQTKEFSKILKALKLNGKKVLLLTGDVNANVWKSGRNIEKVDVLEVSKASTYNLLNNQILIIQKSALASINNTYSAKKEEVA